MDPSQDPYPSIASILARTIKGSTLIAPVLSAPPHRYLPSWSTLSCQIYTDFRCTACKWDTRSETRAECSCNSCFQGLVGPREDDWILATFDLFHWEAPSLFHSRSEYRVPLPLYNKDIGRFQTLWNRLGKPRDGVGESNRTGKSAVVLRGCTTVSLYTARKPYTYVSKSL